MDALPHILSESIMTPLFMTSLVTMLAALGQKINHWTDDQTKAMVDFLKVSTQLWFQVEKLTPGQVEVLNNLTKTIKISLLGGSEDLEAKKVGAQLKAQADQLEEFQIDLEDLTETLLAERKRGQNLADRLSGTEDKFYELEDRYTHLEIQHSKLGMQFTDLSDKYRTMEEQLVGATDKLLALEQVVDARLTNLETRVEKLEGHLAEVDEQIDEIDDHAHNLTNKVAVIPAETLASVLDYFCHQNTAEEVVVNQPTLCEEVTVPALAPMFAVNNVEGKEEKVEEKEEKEEREEEESDSGISDWSDSSDDEPEFELELVNKSALHQELTEYIKNKLPHYDNADSLDDAQSITTQPMAVVINEEAHNEVTPELVDETTTFVEEVTPELVEDATSVNADYELPPETPLVVNNIDSIPIFRFGIY